MTELPAIQVPATDVRTQQDWHQQHPSWLYASVLEGVLTNHSKNPQDAVVSVDQFGVLPLPTGRLVAGDIYIMDNGMRPLEPRR